jgi:ABC-type dipeptide/oligopeptide/nickel transport system permease component
VSGAYLLKRLAGALGIVLGVALLTALLIHLVPGDPVELMLGESATAGDRAALRARLGLDRPLHQQLLGQLGRLARLDLGDSLYSRRPVSVVIAERLPATVELAVAALAVAAAVALPLGILAARHRGGLADSAAMGVALLGLSIPSFWLGPLLILLFSVVLGWTPVSGREGLASLVLPALTLGTGMAAVLARMLRSSLLETLSEDYVRTARAKGLSPAAVLRRHALRNAALPVVTVFGMQAGALFAGAVITETVFAWPGVGSLLVEAIQRRDFPVVQGCVLLISTTYVLVNAGTDLAYAWLDPRVRVTA